MKKWLRKVTIIQLLILLSVSWVNAQEVSISGKVSSKDGNPVPGVSVVVKGTTVGILTDSDGHYTLKVPTGSKTLVFRFVGMKAQEVPITASSVYNVELEEDTYNLEEVVAVGYGAMKKSDLTGSVASVKSDDINAFPNTTVPQALQGHAAGVQVSQNTGAPGATIQVRIRGTNSIKGSNAPLWVIDGFPGDINMLNANDIESMEVLKDASATAIYGSRGANGVIIVTTKRGKIGTTRVDYEGSYSIQTIRQKLDLMNAKEYAQFYNIQQLNDLGKEYFSSEEINNFGKGTDWQDLIFRAAPLHDHSLTVSGGNEKTQFSVGGSFYDQEGIIKNSNYGRITLRANINHDISKKLSISYNAILSRADNSTKNSGGGNRGGSLISAIVSAPPTTTAYNDDGTYRLLTTVYPFSGNAILNPLAYVNEASSKWFSTRVNANLALTYKPIDGLSVKISGNVLNNDSRTDGYTTLLYPGSSGNASISASNGLSLNSDNIVTYVKTFNEKHNLSITAGYTYEQYVAKSVGVSGTGFLSDVYESYNIGSASTLNTPSSSYSKWVLMSYLGRVNYSFNDKYLATLSFRSDGSSRYSPGNKWGYFPSGALAYRISNENFMKKFGFISDLKIRAGYGESGSTAINPYSTLDMLSSGKTTFGEELYTYFAASTTYPGNLKWETTAQSNVGIDVSFLENRIRVTADYYIKNTRNLLNTVQLPQSTGYTTTIKNVGKMQNKGIDMQVDVRVLDRGFKWDVSANVSANRNKIVKLYEGQDIKGSSFNLAVVNDYINLLSEGHPMGAFYGYQTDGYTSDGKLAYKDNDLSGGVSVGDKAFIGDPNPDFIYGITSNMAYKNFELNVFIQGTQGNDIFSLSMLNQTLDYGFALNTFKDVLYDHWTPETPNAKYPYISSKTSTLMCDRFVYDGSYLRVKNIELAYNLPTNKLGIRWFKRGQVYVSGQNLLTFTSYPWFDPDVNSQGGDTSVDQGIDYYTYPTAKSITFGVKLGF